MLPVYIWIMVFVGYERGGDQPQLSLSGSAVWIALTTALAVLGIIAIVQLFEFPFRTTAAHSIFRLAVINARGERAERARLYLRWAVVWLPLVVPMLLAALLVEVAPTTALLCSTALLFLWIAGAIYTVVHPERGLHDRVAGTWVVRR
jgi:hypothetical protein